MKRFFTCDLHFGHRNIINFCHRPYNNVEEMDSAIIKQWNAQVSPEDEVYFLGDFGINKRKCLDEGYVKRLNGKKFIILGNHDSYFVRGHEDIVKFESQYVPKFLKAGWEGAYIRQVITLLDGTMVNLSHLPPCDEDDTRYGKFKQNNNPEEIYLHGHLHGHYIKKRNMIDVSFDANLTLFSELDIIDIIKDTRHFIPTRLTKMNDKLDAILDPYEYQTKMKNLRKVVDGDLVLYNYTDQCIYNKTWNDITLSARGIIFNRNTGQLVALPFPKFFNIGEVKSTFMDNLPNEDYAVTEKMDGSLGIIYYNNGWNVATRGSFLSEQAQEAKVMLDTLYKPEYLNKDYTYLVEIIYPSNKIVVNYKDKRGLVLLGVMNIKTRNEVELCDYIADATVCGFELVKRHKYSINEMQLLRKTIPKDEEGFVVKYSSGFRVKIKGDEYCKIHRLVSHMSPIAFWKCMENGIVKIDYLQDLPEEFRIEADAITNILQRKYSEVFADVYNLFATIPNDNPKELGIYIQKYKPEHSSAMFPIYHNNIEGLNRYIMNTIRPHGNDL